MIAYQRILQLRRLTLGDHLKTGHRGSLQKRPTELAQDNLIYTLPGGRWQ
jgi:hypothetical protein